MGVLQTIDLKVSEKLEELKSLSATNAPVDKIANCYYHLGIAYMNQNESEQALEAITEAMNRSLVNQLDSLTIKCLDVFGSIHSKSKQFLRAIEYYKRAKELAKASTDEQTLPYIYNNIGFTYQQIGRISDALEMYSLSIESAERLGEVIPTVFANHNMGDVLLNEKRYEEALPFLNKSIEFAEQNGVLRILCDGLTNLARYNIQMNKLPDALNNLKKSLSIYDEKLSPNFSSAFLKNSYYFTEYYIQSNELRKAEEKAQASLDYAREEGDDHYILRFIECLKEIASREKKFEKAFEYGNQYIEIGNSLQKFERISANTSMSYAIQVQEQSFNERLKRVNEEAQQKLMKQNERLHAEIQKRSITEEKLKAVNTELQQFAYSASHDLQEPLRMITSYLGILKRRLKDRLSANDEELMFFVTDGAKRMKDLLDGILSYSRTNTDKRPLQEVELLLILEKVMLNLNLTIREKNAVINLADNLPTSILVDQQQIIQLFQNLLGNALKFAKENERLEVNIGYEDHGDKHCFYVADNGVGFDEKFANRVFTMFQRLVGRNQYEGYGIGLAICKNIVKRHSGKIWVQAAVGVGATFYFTLSKENVQEEEGEI